MQEFTVRPVPFSDISLQHGVVTAINHDMSEMTNADDILTIGVVDSETASKDPAKPFDYVHDKVVEVTIAKVLVNRNNGSVLKIVSALNQLNDPGFSIPPESTEITGITDGDVTGKSFDDELTSAFISDIDIMLAHNAKFDRGMLQGLTRIFDDKTWACTSKGDIDWKIHGHNCGKLECLVLRSGGVYDAHRATPDVFALIYLLSKHPNALYCILQSATTPSYEVRAAEAPRHVKDDLKLTMGYSAHYESDKFQYWHKVGLDKESAENEVIALQRLYGADPEKCLVKTPIKDRYKLA